MSSVGGIVETQSLKAGTRNLIKNNLPSTLTLMRAIATSILFVTLLEGRSGFPIFAVACLTDVFDGVLARRLHVESEAGGVFDASVDFVLVSSTTLYLVYAELASVWFLALILFAFFKYLLFRGLSDPLGKHVGTILFVSLGTILMFPVQFVANWACFFASCYILAAMTTSLKSHLERAGVSRILLLARSLIDCIKT
jgi:phosphatidylglycerophosphate synthase